MAVIGNAPFQGLVSGGNIIDASIEGVDLSTSAIAARLGYTPVDPGAAVFSANPTISSGTANQVQFLNGSKVVSGSSNLTFNGTTLTAADLTDSSLTAGRVVYAGTGGNLNDSANLLFSGQSLTVTNNNSLVAGSSALVVNGGTNLAISASVTGEAYVVNTASTRYEYYQAGTIASLSAASSSVNSGALIDINAYNASGGATGVYIGAVAGATGNGPANFVIGRRTGTNSWAESVRIDTSGNFKLNSGYMSFGDNGYIRADSAGWLQLQSGTSGTRIMNSSNAAAQVTVSSNGFVGIGTNNPSTHLHLQSNNADPFNTVDTVLTLTQGGGNSGSGTQINFTQGAGTNWIRSVVTGGNSTTGSALVFGTAATGVVGTERMRIASTGFVGIGTTNPQSKLHVAGDLNQSMSLVAGASADGAIAYTKSEFRECAFNVTSGSNFRISNITTSATSWRAVFRGTWSNNYEGGGLTPPAPYIEVNSTNNSFLVGSRTLAVDRDANGYLVVSCTDAYRISFSGSIEIYDNPQSGQPANSIVTIGKVGVGLRNPNYPLEVAGGVASRGTGFILRNDAGSSNTGIFSPYNVISGSGTDYSSTIFSETGLGIYFCVNGSATRSAILNSSGNFGLGTTDINYKITNSGHLAFTTGSSNTDGAGDAQRNGMGWQATGGSGVLSSFITANNQGNWGSDLQFFTRGASGGLLNERMRITYDGNMLVSKQVTSVGTAGHTLGAGGFTYHTYNGGNVMWLNRLSSNGDIQIWQQGTTDKIAAGTYNGSPYIGGASGSNSAGFMFNGASIEPTYNGGSARTDLGVDLGSTNYRWKRGHFSDFCIGTTATPPVSGLRVGGATNPAGGIVSTNLIMGYVASNYTGTRYWLLHQMQTGAGVDQSAFNCMGDIHASSYTTWNLCNLWIRREYATTNVYANITGMIKNSVTVSVVDITYSNVRYVAIKFAGGDPGIEANLVGYLMDQQYTNGGTDARFIYGTTGVTENAVIASY